MIEQLLYKAVEKAVLTLYEAEGQSIQFQKTRKDFEGDITLVVFPFLRVSKKGPEQTADELGQYLQEQVAEVCCYNVVKGFLNLSIDKSYWLSQFSSINSIENYGTIEALKDAPTFLVEYSSPNTNKPLHLGHIRNNLLGYSVAQILKASGKKVLKVQIINDRGIHICKSMIAWQLFGKGQTPESAVLKGDHLVGKYYVEFDKHYKAEQADLVAKGMSQEEAAKQAPIFLKAQEMLRQWEAKDPSVYALWEQMNAWVYEGFDFTYKRLGVDFDKNYYESDTYLLGKEVIKEGLKKELFYQKEDGSVWIDLSEEGLDEKLLLRSDGTAVYMTQDIGTAIQRHTDFGFSNMVYTVGNEQDYHFKVLFLILDKLGYAWAKNCYHLSYGMVDLPTGKMKSREGTVVDADELMQEMVDTAKTISQELGKLDGLNQTDANALYEQIGLGALKYFMLKVDPKKRMLFDPEESIDFNGNTGPFIQYTYARIQSILRRYEQKAVFPDTIDMIDKEKEIIKLLLEFPTIIQQAAELYSPAFVANYVYELVKTYNTYYQNTPILVGDNEEQIAFRVALSVKVAQVIKTGMNLLGVSVPNRM